jgi:signal transduction histidine kinase
MNNLERIAQLEAIIEKQQQEIQTLRELNFSTIDLLVWRHRMSNYIGSIKSYIQVVSLCVEQNEHDLLLETIAYKDQVLDRIKLFATEIEDISSSIDAKSIVNVDEFIKETIQREELIYQGQGIDLTAVSGVGVNIYLNPQWLRYCIKLLLDNAQTAMQEAPKKIIILSTSKNEDKVHIFISDTGTGIPEDIRENLFNKIIKQESKKKGLGIGLLIIKEIVQYYKGDIRLAYTGINGTSFAIDLPIHQFG